MAERGILFSAPMVRALLAGTKTQTRRALRKQPPAWAKFPQAVGIPADGLWEWTDLDEDSDTLQHWPDYDKPMRCPYGKPGDRLWVRETWSKAHDAVDFKLRGQLLYRAGPHDPRDLVGVKWKPAIHMPRTFSRITLEITAVRVERLQDISDGDAWDEGTAQWAAENPPRMPNGCVDKFNNIRLAYRALWESINGPGSWDANSWVWVIAFRRIEGASAMEQSKP